jgi:hypothetical protein
VPLDCMIPSDVSSVRQLRSTPAGILPETVLERLGLIVLGCAPQLAVELFA